jgi:hypothetical protein
MGSSSPGTPSQWTCSPIQLQSGSLPPEIVPAVVDKELTPTASLCLRLDPVPKSADWDFIVTRIRLTLTQENDLEVRVIVGTEDN